MPDVDTSRFGLPVQIEVSHPETPDASSVEFGRVVNWEVDANGHEWVKVELCSPNPVKVWVLKSEVMAWNTPHRDLAEGNWGGEEGDGETDYGNQVGESGAPQPGESQEPKGGDRQSRGTRQ